MKNELNKKAEELEQTLQMQLDLAKKESEDWIKVGGVVLAGALITFATVKLLGRKKNKKTQKVKPFWVWTGKFKLEFTKLSWNFFKHF